jgi:hypothetical protein
MTYRDFGDVPHIPSTSTRGEVAEEADYPVESNRKFSQVADLSSLFFTFF